MTHQPQVDELPEAPVDWVDIPLGPGQEPNFNGHDGAFQFSKDEPLYDPSSSVRRNPDESWEYISRVPERP